MLFFPADPAVDMFIRIKQRLLCHVTSTHVYSGRIRMFFPAIGLHGFFVSRIPAGDRQGCKAWEHDVDADNPPLLS